MKEKWRGNEGEREGADSRGVTDDGGGNPKGSFQGTKPPIMRKIKKVMCVKSHLVV